MTEVIKNLNLPLEQHSSNVKYWFPKINFFFCFPLNNVLFLALSGELDLLFVFKSASHFPLNYHYPFKNLCVYVALNTHVKGMFLNAC